MTHLVAKSLLSGIPTALISQIARRSPGFAALVASLPLDSILGAIWMWRDTGDMARNADVTQATFWSVLPSLPVFAIVPMLLRSGVGFLPALIAGCVVTVLLCLGLVSAARRFGIRL